MYLLTVVAGVLIDTEGRVLLAQRKKRGMLKGLWEFPGGKMERGETPETALARELGEEIGIKVRKADLAPLTFASHTYYEMGFHLLMPVYGEYEYTLT